MDNASLAKDLLQSAVNYHGSLVRLARGTERLRELMDFIVRCIDFAERNFPRPTYAHWIAENPFIPLVAERSKPLFSFQSIDPEIELDHLLTSGSTGSTHAYSFITGNFNFLETKAARDEFGVLSNLYRGLLSRPEDVNRVHVFLAP